jgi:hypothetical protein
MDKLQRLIKCNEHLSIALAELGKIAGGSYVGSLEDLKKLIAVKIRLENIIINTKLGEKTEIMRKRLK